MNKPDLITHVSDIAGLTKADTGKAVDAVFDAIKAALTKGEEVGIKGFGTFSAIERPERTGRNPRTGEPVPIPASKAPKFKPAKVLRGAVQG